MFCWFCINGVLCLCLHRVHLVKQSMNGRAVRFLPHSGLKAKDLKPRVLILTGEQGIGGLLGDTGGHPKFWSVRH